MNKYIKLCRQPQKPKLSVPRHLVEEAQINEYSIKEMMDLTSLRQDLLDCQIEMFDHITKHCEVCSFLLFLN